MNTGLSPSESFSEDQPLNTLAEPVKSPSELEELPLVDRLFIDNDVPVEIVREISAQILPDESIFVLFQLNASHNFVSAAEEASGGSKIEKVPLWTIVTGTRLLLLAVSSQGQTYCDVFAQDSVIEYQNGLARDEIRIADKTITTGIWEGKRKLFKEAVSLFPLSEYEKYLYIAGIYLKDECYTEALPFLQTSLTLEPTIKTYLLLAHTFSRTGTPDKAIDVLQQACLFAEPAAIITEIQQEFADNLVMFLYLAVVCEKNQWWEHGIGIYQHLLQKTPDFDLYLLKLGELHSWNHDYSKAIECYQAFIQQRTVSTPPEGSDFTNWDLSDSKCFAADPDLIKAFFDLGIIYECELHDPHNALANYLTLLRHAPFYIEAYQHFWQVYQQLQETQEPIPQIASLNISMFLQAYRLLHPQNYATTLRSQDSGTILDMMPDPSASSASLAYRPLCEQEQALLPHPGELEYWRRVQNWITTLVVSDDEEQAIEQYCEQVSQSNYPDLFRIIELVATFVGITPPRCFISRSKIGVSVKNKEHPFIFIGSEHLNEENERYLAPQELLFIMAAQAEHIKSGHILITSTELWKSLGTASFDGFLVALQFLPAGSFLGRLTHHFATEGLKKVYKMTKHSTVRKVLDFVEKHVTDRPQEESQADYADYNEEAADSKSDVSTSKKTMGSDAVLREQLVDFARHAVYTADRAGILASHDLHAACSAIFKLAGDAYDDLKSIKQDGLLALVKKQDKREKYIYFEYAKRLSELLQFVLSETYQHLHTNILVEPLSNSPSASALPDHTPLLNKLTLLEQSRQSDLLTQEEFFLKQQQLFERTNWLVEDDAALLRKYQQACQDNVLTYEELQIKIIQLLTTRRKGKEEHVKAPESDE
jgi:hypothetical protein